MLLADLVTASTGVALASGRLDKVRRLAELLGRLAGDEIEIAVAFLSGGPRQGRVGIGHAAIREASSAPPVGGPTLTLAEVDATFGAAAAITGAGSAAARSRLLRDLYARATKAEQDFLSRLLYGELRHGALEGVLADAVARATSIAPEKIRRASMMTGDLGVVARTAFAEGRSALDALAMQLMRPVQPMLAETEESVGAALSCLGDAALDYKLDGARIQIHKADDDVRVFSRTLRDVTPAVPEIVSVVRALPARSLILDGEAIALRPDGTPHPFQVTMQRFGRKRGGAPDDVQHLTPFFFDCLYADDASLLDAPLEQRLAELGSRAGSHAVPAVVRPTAAEAQAFAQTALARGHEGVMAKALTSPYAAGRRGGAWLKIKPARTLDLVVLAAEWGHGRRKGWLSNLHLGAHDPRANGFVMLGKTFKGLTDEVLTWQTERLLSLEMGRDAYTVYVKPLLVVEIAFNDVQRSPVYPGGVALRFARVKRYRTDKTAAEADTIDAVRRLLPEQ